jgi:hypothetical protein
MSWSFFVFITPRCKPNHQIFLNFSWNDD